MYIKIHIKQNIIRNTLLNNDQIDGINEVCTIDISKTSLKWLSTSVKKHKKISRNGINSVYIKKTVCEQ